MTGFRPQVATYRPRGGRLAQRKTVETMAAKKSKNGTRELSKSRAFLQKHARIKKSGRVKLEKGWTDKKIAKKAKSKVGLVRELRVDLYGRLREEVAREPRPGK
jgi:hypothetical protein